MRTIEVALVEINTDPERGHAQLRAALEQLRQFAPRLARDPATQELRTMAELALARAELALGDREAASATLDATLAALGDMPVASDRLGPTLGALVEERQGVIEARGTARLQIECSVPCRVLVDERMVGELEAPGSADVPALPLGDHRVWIEELVETGANEFAPRRTTITLDSADALLSLVYPEQTTQAPAPALGRSKARSNAELDLGGPPRRRVAPRWAELTTLVSGGAAIVAGAVLWALDSRCPRGVDPTDVAACPELYDTRAAGIALVSAGALASVTGGVMLIVDETRVGERSGRELGLRWTVRF